MEQSDEVLIEAHLQGDPKAFGDLVRRHSDPLLGYLVQRSGNRHHAEDCFQETFMRVHKKASSFNGRSRISVGRNLLTDHACRGTQAAFRSPSAMDSPPSPPDRESAAGQDDQQT